MELEVRFCSDHFGTLGYTSEIMVIIDADAKGFRIERIFELYGPREFTLTDFPNDEKESILSACERSWVGVDFDDEWEWQKADDAIDQMKDDRS